MRLGSLGCKIRVPYFGTIHITPGKRIKESNSVHQPSPLAGTPIAHQQHRASPVTSIEHHNVPPSSTASCVLPSPSPSTQVLDTLDASISFENILALPNANFDSNFVLPTPESTGGGHISKLDLRLHQGWNFDWLDMSGIQV